MTVCLVTTAETCYVGLSCPKRLLNGLSKFLKLLNPTSSVSSEVTSSDSPKFRDVLNAATGVNVNAYTEIIFLKLASSKSDAAGASAKANPSRNMKRKSAALDAPQAGVVVDEKLIDRLQALPPSIIVPQEAAAQKLTESVKKRPALFNVEDEATDICRLSEGNEHAEEFVSWSLLLIRGALSGSHSCPTQKAQMADFSRQTRAMLSNGQLHSPEEALSQLERVLLPKSEELHSFNASVETESVYKEM
jgi:hypothetical protein